MMFVSDWRRGLTSKERHRNQQAFPRSWSGTYFYREDSKQETEQDIMRDARQETQKGNSSPRRSDRRCPRGGSTLTRRFHGALSGDTSKSPSPPTTPLLLVSASPAAHLSRGPKCRLSRLRSAPLHTRFNISWFSWKRDEQHLSVHVPLTRFVTAIIIFFTPEDAKETAASWKGSVLEDGEMQVSSPRCHLWRVPRRLPRFSGKPGSFQPRG